MDSSDEDEVVWNIIDVEHMRDLQPDNSSRAYRNFWVQPASDLHWDDFGVDEYHHHIASVEEALVPEFEAIMEHETMHAVGLQVFRIPHPTAAKPEDVRFQALLYVQGKQEGGGSIAQDAIEKIVAESNGRIASYGHLSVPSWPIYKHLTERPVQRRGKQKAVEQKTAMSALDVADEDTLSKPELQRLVRGLKRQRTTNREQLAKAERAVAMYEKSTYSEIYEQAPAHLPLQVVPGATDGVSRYEGYSANLIWEYWSRQPDFIFPQYISVDDPRERREAYGLRAEELYPPMVTERDEKARQSAYTTYYDKKALAINNEEAVVKHGAQQR